MQPTSRQQALERYTAAYDNANYMDIRHRIIIDFFGKDAEYTIHEANEQVIDLMNALQDTCLECCGADQHRGSHITLAKLAAWGKLGNETINAIQFYLLRFEREGSTIAVDFECSAKALSIIHQSIEQVSTGTAHTNGIHAWQGRMAYHLLAAAEYLLRTAELLVERHNDLGYIREKLKYGLNRITNALYEGIRFSDKPEMFNLKSTYFPDEQDR